MLRVVLVALALAAAGGAVWLTVLQPKPDPTPIEAAPAPPPEVDVLVAAGDIARGAQLSRADLSWETWPVEAATHGAIRRTARPEAIVELAGARARAVIAAGAPVLEADLLAHPGGLLAAALEPGERALAVRVSAESAAGGFVLPGDRVDVLLTVPPDSERDARVETVLSNVEILAIDQTDRETSDAADAQVGKTATLRMTEAQAHHLAQAMATGHLSLALRSPIDAEIAQRPVPEPEPEAPASAPTDPERALVVVRRAGAVETVSVP